MAYQRYCNEGPPGYNSTPAPRRIEVKQRNPYCNTKPMYQSPQQINAQRRSTNNVFDKFMAMGPVQAITRPPQIDKKLLCCFWFRLIEMVGCLICFILGIILICKTDNRMYKYFFTGISCMYLLICIFDLIGYSMNKTIPCLYTWILFTTLGYLLFISAAGLAVIPNAMHWEEYIILVFAIITAIVFLADLIQACRKTHLESLRDDMYGKIHPERDHYGQEHEGGRNIIYSTGQGHGGGQNLIYGTGQGRDPCCFQQEIRPCYKKPVPPPPPPKEIEEKPDPCCFQQEIRPCHKLPPPPPKQEIPPECTPDPCCFDQEIPPCYKSPPKQEEPVCEEPKLDICERSGDTIYLCVDECGQACYKKKEKIHVEKHQTRHDDPIIYLCVDECGQPCYKIKESCEEQLPPPECPPPLPPRPPSREEPSKHNPNIIICVDECGKPCYKFVDEDYTTETQTRNVLYEQDENVPYYRRPRCDDRERSVLKEQGRNSPMKRAHSPEVNESFSQGKIFSSIPIVLATNETQKQTYPIDPVISQSIRIKETINSTNRSRVCAALKRELTQRSREHCTGPFVSKKMKEDENCQQVQEIIQQNINEIKKSLLERSSKDKIEKTVDKTDKIESPSKATEDSFQKIEENKELTLVYKSIETTESKSKHSEAIQEFKHSEVEQEPKHSEIKQESKHSEMKRESEHTETKQESKQELEHSEHLESVEPESSPVVERKSVPVTPTTTPREQSDRVSLPGATDTEEKHE